MGRPRAPHKTPHFQHSTAPIRPGGPQKTNFGRWPPLPNTIERLPRRFFAHRRNPARTHGKPSANRLGFAAGMRLAGCSTATSTPLARAMHAWPRFVHAPWPRHKKSTAGGAKWSYDRPHQWHMVCRAPRCKTRKKEMAPAGNRSHFRKANHLTEWPLRWNQL